MRHILLLALLILAAMPVSAQSLDVGTVFVTDDAGDSVPSSGLDIAVATGSLHFVAEITGGPETAQVVLTHDCGGPSCTTISRTLVSGAGANWTASLAISEPELVEGDWSVLVTAYGAGGATDAASGPTLAVVSSDEDAPVLDVVGGSPSVEIGATDAVRFSIVDDTLQYATFTMDDMEVPALFVPPYVLSADLFLEGNHTVFVLARDRSGNEATMTVDVRKDSVAPFLELDLPPLFRGVDTNLTIGSADTTQYDLQLKAGNETQHVTNLEGEASTEFTVRFDELGNTTIWVSAWDLLGNRVDQRYDGKVVDAETDLILEGVTVEAEHLLQGETARLNVTLRQDFAVAPIPVTLTMSGPDGDTTQNVTVPEDGAIDVLIEVPVPLGASLFEFEVHVGAPFVELDPENQTANATVEVFLGRVIDASGTYHIRAGPFGLPTVAVDGSGDEIPLSLQEAGSASVYAFTDSGRDLHWDPQNAVTDLTVDTEETGTGTPENEAPGVPALLLLLALFAVALLRRR